MNVAAVLARSVVLVRHGWAGDRGHHAGDDRERPLDGRGRRQAEDLPALLDGVLGSALAHAQLLSSPLTRCVQTLEPLAAVLGTTVALDERLAEAAVPLSSTDGWPDAPWFAGRALSALVAAGPGPGPLVLCGHGEILPALLAILVAIDDRRASPELDLSAKALDKGAAWFLPVGRPDVVQIPAPDHHGRREGAGPRRDGRRPGPERRRAHAEGF